MKVVIKRASKTIGHVEKQNVRVTKLENVRKLDVGVEYDTDILRIDLKIGEESFQERFSLKDRTVFLYSHLGTAIRGSVVHDRDSFIEYLYKLTDSSELTIERSSLYKNYDPPMKVTAVLKEYEVTLTNSDGMILTITSLI